MHVYGHHQCPIDASVTQAVAVALAVAAREEGEGEDDGLWTPFEDALFIALEESNVKSRARRRMLGPLNTPAA